MLLAAVTGNPSHQLNRIISANFNFSSCVPTFFFELIVFNLTGFFCCFFSSPNRTEKRARGVDARPLIRVPINRCLHQHSTTSVRFNHFQPNSHSGLRVRHEAATYGAMRPLSELLFISNKWFESLTLVGFRRKSAAALFNEYKKRNASPRSAYPGRLECLSSSLTTPLGSTKYKVLLIEIQWNESLEI